MKMAQFDIQDLRMSLILGILLRSRLVLENVWLLFAFA